MHLYFQQVFNTHVCIVTKKHRPHKIGPTSQGIPSLISSRSIGFQMNTVFWKSINQVPYVHQKMKLSIEIKAFQHKNIRSHVCFLVVPPDRLLRNELYNAPFYIHCTPCLYAIQTSHNRNRLFFSFSSGTGFSMELKHTF